MRQGIAFALEGADEVTFMRVLNDVMHDEAFSRPLQVQAQEPRRDEPGRLVIAFHEADRTRAVAAMQRLKTILLRHGLQVDNIHFPNADGI